MRKVFIIAIFVLISGIVFIGIKNLSNFYSTGAPPYGEPEENAPEFGDPWFYNWKRPEGPAKVAIQVGHLKNNEFPEELEKLRGNSGATGGGKSEWEVNLAIAKELEILLKENGASVEILPATVPPSYWADVFVAIHADGSTDKTKRGFKFAGPWRDYTQKSGKLVEILEESYKDATGFEIDPNVTRNMRGYYAFAWWRYDHAIHPMTTAVIAETGFLTNAADRKTIVDNPGISAQGIADGIIEFLRGENLL